jgi:hypothetical protein
MTASKTVQLERIGLKIRHQAYQFRRPLTPVARHAGVVLHHMGRGSWANDTRNPGQVVHKMHLIAEGGTWLGIGYHGIATQQGQYFTGRTYRHSGSHARGANSEFGLLWFGGLKDQPTEAALHTLAQAIAWVAIDNDFTPSTSTVRGHCDVLNTQCPGNLYQHIPDLIRRANAIIAQAKTGPVQSAAPVQNQGTLPAPPMQIATARAIVNGIEREALLINGRGYIAAADLGATWDAETRTLVV